MKSFEYHEPTAVGDACLLLQQYGQEAVVYAGGSYLTILMKQGMLRPKALINIKRIKGLNRINKSNDGSLLIGALVTHHELETSQVAHGGWSILCRAERDVANIRVRNTATVGGNLASGEPLTDLPCIFLALDARLHAVGAGGERTIAVEDFFVDYYQTVLEADEILTEVVVPPLAANTKAEYLRFTSGSIVDKPSVGVAARITVEPGNPTCKDVRIALGCVAPTPMRALEAESILAGERFNGEVVEKAASSAARECSPLEDLRGSELYKREMVRAMVRRAVAAAYRRASNGDPEK